MKIYTKGGDKGKTSLFGQARVDKDDIRIEAYGTVDELNSSIGLLESGKLPNESKAQLLVIQKKLFDIGSHLASDPEFDYPLPQVSDKDSIFLEKAIDQMNEELTPLKNFILPGGSSIAAKAHVCRTICRRAERRVVTLSKVAQVEPEIIIYLNRLSDYFFVLARFLLKKDGLDEVAWTAEM